MAIARQLRAQFTDQRAVSHTAYYGYVRGDRVGGHPRGDQHGGRRSAEVVGRPKPDADSGGCMFISPHGVRDEE
jgi:hypothetical protein